MMKIDGKFLRAFWFDTIGQEDKAHAITGDTPEKKAEYRKTAALLCAVLAVGGTLIGVATVGFPVGLIPLALLLVSARKLQINAKKAKQAAAPNALFTAPAEGSATGTKSLAEKLKWQRQNFMIQLRTRSSLRLVAPALVVAGLVAVVAVTAVKHVNTAQKGLSPQIALPKPSVPQRLVAEPTGKPIVAKPAKKAKVVKKAKRKPRPLTPMQQFDRDVAKLFS